MRTTILGGVLFLAPFAVIALILGKVFQMSTKIVEPLDRLMPVASFAGVATLNILAVIFILLVCYLAGIAARRAFLGRRMQRIDGFLVDMIPSYAVFKGMVGSVSADDALNAMMRPVLVRFDDYEQIAFLTESGEESSVIFLPGSPSAWGGSAVILSNDRITGLELPAHQATKLLRTFGRGSLSVKESLAKAASTPAQSP